MDKDIPRSKWVSYKTVTVNRLKFSNKQIRNMEAVAKKLPYFKERLGGTFFYEFDSCKPTSKDPKQLAFCKRMNEKTATAFMETIAKVNKYRQHQLKDQVQKKGSH